MTDPGRSWEANSVRIVLFPSTGPTGVDVWRSLFRSDPDIEEVRPRERFKRQGGPFRDGQLEIVTTPIRIDIILSLRASEVQPSSFPSMVLSVGDFATELNALVDPVKDWLSRKEIQFQRLAVSGAALMQADSVEGAYSILAEKIRSVRVVPGRMSEFSYRVNWKVGAEVSDIEYCNRLQTWSSLVFGMQAAVSPEAPRAEVLSEYYACLELDINTPAERASPLVADDLVAILDHLVYLALDNLENGECPTDF